MNRLCTLPIRVSVLTILVAFAVAGHGNDATAADDTVLKLNVRERVETSEGSGRYHAVPKSVEWDARQTAIVICDMWDKHWCPNATARVAEMAPRMNEVVEAARKRGVFIIHCPSSTLDFYKETPQRALALQAPPVATKRPLEHWCHLDKDREGERLPIDDSDGGCDSAENVKSYTAWTRQIASIRIADGDAITDSAEAWYLMRQRGITNVIVMGVHTNMCVLGRPFSIRQMVYQGQQVLLMRDMTDTMYNPAMRPFVSHFTGTDLVVEHIEKYWCPTITSSDFLGGDEFRFAEDHRPHVVIITAEREYDTVRTLPEFALTQLGQDYRVSILYGDETDRNNLPGIDVIRDADVLLVSARRRILPPKQMQRIRDYVQAGRPVVGIRTASHAFSLRNEKPPEGFIDWPGFDAEVFGGNYTNHHGAGPSVTVQVAKREAKHPILRNMDPDELHSAGSLYKVSPLRSSAKPILIGSIPDTESEPVAWTNHNVYGGRTFYTSMGHPDDFKLASFNQLLKNAIDWAAGQRPMPK